MGFKIYNISGGPFLVVKDFFYVYFDEFVRFKSGAVEPRVAVIRAKISDVLSSVNTPDSCTMSPEMWKKLEKGSE